LISMVVAFAIGIYDGFYGPGTGTFLLLLLTGIAHMELTKANGLTKVINLTSNIAALTVYLINGKALLALGLCAGVFNIAGNYIGASLFKKGGAKFTRPVMILVLLIFFIKVLYELLTK
ncbi:MAG: TSUP family transporter, partial [Oscillospiraceae bacterium]|nr:TSUP family transporter [Oscillospiraceae bacterium]